MPHPITFNDVLESGLPMCNKCRALLENEKGTVEIVGIDVEQHFRPRMWRHSERDVFHAWIYIAGRHVILCGTDEFDERTLKRIKPLKIDDNLSWQIFIDGKTYTILDHEDGTYEILNQDGTIVKDEIIEARVFHYMMNLEGE